MTYYASDCPMHYCIPYPPNLMLIDVLLYVSLTGLTDKSFSTFNQMLANCFTKFVKFNFLHENSAPYAKLCILDPIL